MTEQKGQRVQLANGQETGTEANGSTHLYPFIVYCLRQHHFGENTTKYRFHIDVLSL